MTQKIKEIKPPMSHQTNSAMNMAAPIMPQPRWDMKNLISSLSPLLVQAALLTQHAERADSSGYFSQKKLL